MAGGLGDKGGLVQRGDGECPGALAEIVLDQLFAATFAGKRLCSLHEFIAYAGGDALDPADLDHGNRRPLAGGARFEEAGK